MSALLFSSTVLASFVGGVLALLAPCCISVMLPAYFASTFRRRTRIVAMTLVFAAGVGTVILPIALGATALSRLLVGQHAWVFGIGGLLMVGAGLAMLAGKTFSLPMLGRSGANDGSMRSVYGLGVFSGGASACCAPVLIGVAALAGASASFPVALVIGVVYVFGMVAPLAVIAVLWDRRDWGTGNLLRDRQVSLHLGPMRRTLPLTVAVSAVLMMVMGILTAALAFTGRGMATSRWQVEMAASLQHAGAVVLDAVSWMPGWAGALLVLSALGLLVGAGVRQMRSSGVRTGSHDSPASSSAPPLSTPHQPSEDRAKLETT